MISRSSAIAAAALAVVSSCSAQTNAKQGPTRRVGRVTIDEYKQPIVWRPEDNYFKSPGPVRIILTDAATGEKTVLIADDAEGQANGDIVVHGAVRVERSEGILTGRSLAFNGDSQTGSVLEAHADVNGMSLSGARIDLLPGRVIRATDASFTTCERPNPHFHITAKELEVNANRRVKAKRVTVWLGRVRIISLPEITKSFSRSSTSGIPLPGYSKETGIHMRFRDDAVSEPRTLLEYDIVVSMRRTPSGTVSYERDIGHPAPDAAPPRGHLMSTAEPLQSALVATPPPTLRTLSDTPPEPHRRTSLYGLVMANTFVYNRNRTDLRLSRLPEVGISMANLAGQPSAVADGPTRANPSLFRMRDWLVNADAGLGYFQERPTNAEGMRLGVRADASSAYFRIGGGFHTRCGLSAWGNVYGRGTAYALIAPEAELDYLIGKNTLIGGAYLYQKDFGSTPFVFDRRDVVHEIRLRAGHSGTHWAFDMSVDYDLDRDRAYDTIARIVHRLDCIEFGIGYRARSQSLSLIFNLLPARDGGTGNRERETDPANPPAP